MNAIEIKCPKCHWEPKKKSKWYCSCGHVWNTFDTGGVCPACQKKWQNTQCISCEKWSKHLSWYVVDIDLKSEMFNKVPVGINEEK
jgi:hypothetical protein